MDFLEHLSLLDRSATAPQRIQSGILRISMEDTVPWRLDGRALNRLWNEAIQKDNAYQRIVENPPKGWMVQKKEAGSSGRTRVGHPYPEEQRALNSALSLRPRPSYSRAFWSNQNAQRAAPAMVLGGRCYRRTRLRQIMRIMPDGKTHDIARTRTHYPNNG